MAEVVSLDVGVVIGAEVPAAVDRREGKPGPDAAAEFGNIRAPGGERGGRVREPGNRVRSGVL